MKPPDARKGLSSLRPPPSSLFSADHAAQLGPQALDLGELLRDALEERALRLDALVNEEGGGLGAAAEDSGLHELFETLLRVVRELDGDDVVVLGRERALDRAADVAPDGGERFGDARGDVAHRGGDALAARRSEEHTSELQSQSNLVCRLLLEK